MKKFLALAFSFCLIFCSAISANAESMLTDQMAEEFQTIPLDTLTNEFITGMFGTSMEEMAKSYSDNDLKNLCIFMDKLADMGEYAKSYFALELKEKNSNAAEEFMDKEINVSALDLSQISYQELTELKDQINLAIWNSQEWQEVTVPQGVWKVGEDIPAGHWTIKAKTKYASIKTGTALDSTGKDIDSWNSDRYYFEFIYNPNYKYLEEGADKTEIDLELQNGTYVIIDDAEVIFTPYTGKPSLGFK